MNLSFQLFVLVAIEKLKLKIQHSHIVKLTERTC